MVQEVHRLSYDLPEGPGRFTEFDPEDFVKTADVFVKGYLKPGEKIAISVSGGIDSTTAYYLLKEIVPENICGFFINDGLRRIIRGREECEVVSELLGNMPGFEVIHASDKFLPSLQGLIDGEKKRGVFRNSYTYTSNDFLQRIRADKIADGTIRPDID